MSFFAACQAAEHLRINTQCVAIDGWLGDEHVGGSEVFEAFAALLNSRSPANAYFIRSCFSQALQCFDEGSIDLFHIDGFHTYEAVKADFESWLPKMSTRGTVIFHNTNADQDAFGVWRLWNELKCKYPHFRLPHCRGLGVLYVGSEPSPFAGLLRELQQSDGLAAITINLFAKLGAVCIQRSFWEEVEGLRKTRADVIAEREQAVRRTQILEDELFAARQRVELLEPDAALVHRLLASLSWRLTLPLRFAARLVRRGRRSVLNAVRSHC